MAKGELIKKAREQLGLSQIEVANSIGVSKQTLYKYENNIVTNIPSDKIEALAGKLNTTPEHLMGWEDESTGDNNLNNLYKAYGYQFAVKGMTQEDIKIVMAYHEADNMTKAMVKRLLNMEDAEKADVG